MSGRAKILAVGLSPAIQKTLIFNDFHIGEVNRTTSYLTHASGKCINVCRVLNQAGLPADCLTVAGLENKSYFEKLIEAYPMNVNLIETAGRVRTCTTIIDMAERQYTEIVASEPEEIVSEEEERFKAEFLSMLEGSYGAVIFSGSRIRGFSDKIVPFIMAETKRRGLLFVGDYRGADLKNSFIDKTLHPDLVKINADELYDTFGKGASVEERIVELSKELDTIFVISRGAESTLAAEKGELFEVQNVNVPVLNSIGCGDSMTAGITQGLCEGCSLMEAIEKGRDYAALNLQNIQPGWILS